MKLRIGERLILLSILPKQGNFTTLKIVRKLQEELSFGEEEFKKYGIEQEENQIRWDNEKDSKDIKDVVIGEKGHEIICGALKKLDESNSLKENQVGLYERFVLGNDVNEECD